MLDKRPKRPMFHGPNLSPSVNRVSLEEKLNGVDQSASVPEADREHYTVREAVHLYVETVGSFILSEVHGFHDVETIGIMYQLL